MSSGNLKGSKLNLSTVSGDIVCQERTAFYILMVLLHAKAVLVIIPFQSFSIIVFMCT